VFTFLEGNYRVESNLWGGKSSDEEFVFGNTIRLVFLELARQELLDDIVLGKM